MAIPGSQIGFFVDEALTRSAETYPDKVAFIFRGEELSFSSLNDKVKALAGRLNREGAAQADRVAILLPNSISFALAYYATQRIGAVTVVLDSGLQGEELGRVLRDADPKLLVTHKRLLPNIDDALKEFPKLRLWIVEGDGDNSFERRLAPGGGDFVPPSLKLNDDALILYSSGTSGGPKGVVLDYVNLLQYPRTMTVLCRTKNREVWGCILPMSHISGPVGCNEVIDKGSTMVIFDRADDPVAVLEGIQKHKITIYSGDPALFQSILEVPNLKDYDTQSVRLAFVMEKPAPPVLMRAFKDSQPHLRILQTFGSAETSALITVTEPHRADLKLDSIGKPVPMVEAKLVNDRGEEAPEGESGEIITRGPHVMKGYFRKPEETARRIRNGWLYTGEVARRDKDGYLYHLGRK
jgi:long-chain acyl-CoA synthetase